MTGPEIEAVIYPPGSVPIREAIPILEARGIPVPAGFADLDPDKYMNPYVSPEQAKDLFGKILEYGTKKPR